MDDTELQSVPTRTDSPESQNESQTESQAKPQAENQDSQPTTTSDAAEPTSTEPQNTHSVTTEPITTEPQNTQPITTDTTTTNNVIDQTIPTEPQDSQSVTTNDVIATASVPPAKPKKSHKGFIITAAIILVALAIGGTVWALAFRQDNTDDNSGDQSSIDSTIPNRITNFDLAFLEDEETNQLYSPLSIKYALGMLEAGAAGDSQRQIEAAIGSLNPQKYPNNENMSFANALFINDKLPDDAIKSSYIETINERFGAESLRVPFTSANPINNWVSDKTFGLIKDLLTDEDLKSVGGPEQYFALVNALAIDMEWINKIQPYRNYSVNFPHIAYSSSIDTFITTGFAKLPFNNSAMDVDALRIAATIHKYDILNELGVDNIRQTIIDEYTDWLDEGVCTEGWPEPDVYVDQYLEELGDGGYKTVSSSTDFSLYDDDEVKVFAKDLQTYDDITLQYVGIMSKTTSLKDYIQNLTTDKLTSTISQLKTIALENFKDGVLTDITANIPVFKFQDELDLVNTLKGIGITDVFSDTRANLSNLANDSEGIYIGRAVHKTTVDFNNDGIKASAATALVGGRGSSGCGFSYSFDVPVEEIDLTFDNPYLFLIRDKDSGTIWFVGTVYEPTAYTEPEYPY